MVQKKKTKKQQPNSKMEIYSLDTETQLTFDDSFMQYQIECKKNEIGMLEILENRGKITRSERKEQEKQIEKNWDKFISACHDLNIDTRICQKIETYALGYIGFDNNYLYKRKDKKYYHHVTNKKIHEAEHEGKFEECDICNQTNINDVRICENRDYNNFNNNVWEEFLEECVERSGYKTVKGSTHKYRVFIHNLKFDARALEFYINEHSDYFSDIEAVVPDNVYYMLNFKYKGCCFEFVDSFKLVSQSLSNASKLVGMRKTTEDATYTWFDLLKEPGVYNNEISYLKYDTLILQRLLMFIKEFMNIDNLTSSSFAQMTLKKMIKDDDKKYKREYFNKIYKTGITQEQDEYYRKAYFGGITIVQPGKENQQYNSIGFSFDVNSLYPAVMMQDFPDPTSTCSMGSESCFKTYQKKDFIALHAVYRLQVRSLKLKEGMVACFPKKTSRFAQQQAITKMSDISEEGSSIILTLTGLDIMNIEKNYDFKYDFIDGVCFTRKLHTPFLSFVDKYKGVKEQAVRDGNKALKMVAKILLNSVYGKFAERHHDTGVELVFDEKGFPKYREVPNDKDYEQKGNILIATMITAKARNLIISQAMLAVKHKKFDLIYIDTDSIHCNYRGKYNLILKKVAKDIREGKGYNKRSLNTLFVNVCKELKIDYDPSRFGYLKAEGYYDHSCYLGAKRYIEDDLLEGINFKCAGIQAIGREYLMKQGLDYFKYDKEHIMNVPFTKLVKVNGGYKFVDSFKFITAQSDKKFADKVV